jgi:hypothetical protein|tara:strand:- start:149 stop:490 length:342 start_codon:yes stop_codon:yes gene_type:complete
MESFGKTIINLDNQNSILSISGISMMEDAIDFYKDVKTQIDNYFSSNHKMLTIVFELSYFNSSSAKQFIQLLSKLEAGKGKAIWRYPKDHIIMYDRGRELEILVDVPFEFKGV